MCEVVHLDHWMSQYEYTFCSVYSTEYEIDGSIDAFGFQFGE